MPLHTCSFPTNATLPSSSFRVPFLSLKLSWKTFSPMSPYHTNKNFLLHLAWLVFLMIFLMLMIVLMIVCVCLVVVVVVVVEMKTLKEDQYTQLGTSSQSCSGGGNKVSCHASFIWPVSRSVKSDKAWINPHYNYYHYY